MAQRPSTLATWASSRCVAFRARSFRPNSTWCVIDAFDTSYLLFADEVIANILYLAHNIEEELPGTDLTTPIGHAPTISAFVAGGRGPHGGRGHKPTTARSAAEAVACLASAMDVAVST
jgi:hypothetical protein